MRLPVQRLTGPEREEAERILKCLELYEARLAELREKIRGAAKRDEAMKLLRTGYSKVWFNTARLAARRLIIRQDFIIPKKNPPLH
jgi:hypothetical protein